MTLGEGLTGQGRGRIEVPHLGTARTPEAGVRLTPAQERARRRTRSRELVEAAISLDGHVSEDGVVRALEWIRDQYDAAGGGMLIALFGRCYLGDPYVDHEMTVEGSICRHYRAREDVGALYGPARALAAHPAYAYVEVYGDGSIIPVRIDGTPVL